MSATLGTVARSTLLLEEHLTRLADQMTVEMIMTSLADLVAVKPTDQVGTALNLMGATTFDQLPVLADDKLLGAIEREDIETLADCRSAVRDAMRPLTELASVKTSDSFYIAVDQLQCTRYAAVFEPSTDKFCGLLHFSDLNKQAVRIFCYLWLSALEMGLAELVSESHPTLEEWIGFLDEFRQVSVLGRYEYDRRKKIELKPIECVELSDLVKLSKRFDDVLKRLSLSKKQFSDRIDHIITLRNFAMHPVRTLVQSHADVAKLHTRFDDLRSLVRATQLAVTSASSSVA